VAVYLKQEFVKAGVAMQNRNHPVSINGQEQTCRTLVQNVYILGTGHIFISQNNVH
jgi:hypothetical protein